MNRLNRAIALDDRPVEDPVGRPLDDALFRDAMRRVVTAVHVVTSDGPAGRAGLTASAVTSVSDRPPTVLVCVNGESRSAARLIANGVFCINTLAAGDEDIAATFAGRTDLPHHRRFERGVWEPLATGSPALSTSLAAFDCRLIDVRRVATHDVILGEVLAVRSGGNAPALAYFDRTYRSL